MSSRFYKALALAIGFEAMLVGSLHGFWAMPNGEKLVF